MTLYGLLDKDGQLVCYSRYTGVSKHPKLYSTHGKARARSNLWADGQYYKGTVVRVHLTVEEIVPLK